MSKRINIVLPEATIKTIDEMAKPGQRSRFIDLAVQHFVASTSAQALRARLEQTAVRDQDLDQEITSDWFAVDQESWRNLDQQPKAGKKPATPAAGKSTLGPVRK